MPEWIDLLDRATHTGLDNITDLDPETSTDGQVPTSDGLGGIAWEDQAGGPGSDTTALHTDGNAEVTSIVTEKGVPIGADLVVIEDSVSGDTQKAQLANLPVIAGSVENVYATAVKATSGTISVGQAVRTVGWDIGNSAVTVELADASSGATMPAYGIAAGTITNVATGLVIVSGALTNSGVAGLTTGDAVYVDDVTPGNLIPTKPDGTALIQKVGICVRHTGQVNIQVVGAGRTNDVPNIATDNVWMGDANAVATSTSRAGIDTDSADHIAEALAAHASTAISDDSTVGGVNVEASLDLLNDAVAAASRIDALQPASGTAEQLSIALSNANIDGTSPLDIVRSVDMGGGESGLPIMSGANLTDIAGTGETNTASNVGTGADIFTTKAGVDLPFRGVNGINSVTSVVNADNIDLELSGDAASPGNDKLYGTSGTGVKGWYDQPAGGGGGDVLYFQEHVHATSFANANWHARHSDGTWTDLTSSLMGTAAGNLDRTTAGVRVPGAGTIQTLGGTISRITTGGQVQFGLAKMSTGNVATATITTVSTNTISDDLVHLWFETIDVPAVAINERLVLMVRQAFQDAFNINVTYKVL